MPVEDDRTWAQKAWHGFLAVLTAGFRASKRVLSDHGGTRRQVNVTIDLHTMLRQPHIVGLLPADFDLETISEYWKPDRFLYEGTHTGPMRPSVVRRLLCGAELIPAVLSGNGEVLDMGTKQRFFDGYIRRAISIRDGGCVAPGCTAPFSWCQADHVIPARFNGPTSIENGVMRCWHDHALADAGEWEITVKYGVPYVTVLKYRDPSQRPCRNTYCRQQFF